jgi:hypothetical protein
MKPPVWRGEEPENLLVPKRKRELLTLFLTFIGQVMSEFQVNQLPFLGLFEAESSES